MRAIWMCLLLLFGPVATASADVAITHVDPKGRFAHLALDGPISLADAEKFDRLLAIIPRSINVVDVELNSPGGDVLAAIKIGNSIRRRWLWTIVGDDPPSSCASACVLVFAAGAVRIAGDDSVVLIHRPFFDQRYFAGLRPEQAQSQYTEQTKLVASYLTNMGIAPDLFTRMLQVPSDQGERLSLSEMKSMSLTGWDPAYQEWTKAKNSH
jgi:hypothetical protein